MVVLFHERLGFGHAAFFHQLLNAVHDGIKLVLGVLLTLLTAIVRLIGLVFLGVHFLRQQIKVLIRRLAQFLHQLCNFRI